MKIICDYCGNYLDPDVEKCPYCGATNKAIKRTGTGVPTTIEELKQWYVDHNLPDENTTRFFIGRDYAGPKAFGIYRQSDGDFVVYKNKTDGTRVTRYVGKDEAYAVQEIYLKLKEEMQNQKMHGSTYNSLGSTPSRNVSPSYFENNPPNNRKNYNSPPVAAIVIIVLVIIFLLAFAAGLNDHHRGYYYSSYYDGGSSSSWSSSSYDRDSYSSSSSWSSSSWDDDWDSSSSWDSGWSDWDSDW